MNFEGRKDLEIIDWSNIAQNFTEADLLLGNGFSLNITGHFNYDSLFQEFLRNCEPSKRHIFRSFGTNNFEIIQEILINAKRVNILLKIATNSKIDEAIKLLKNELVISIQKTHPYSSQINWNQLSNLSTQLNIFSDIFTLNYDLFLYHIILHMKDKSNIDGRDAPYSDYFWGEYDNQFKQFMNYDDYNHQHVYYLHGALFLFKIPPETLKLKRGDAPKELIEMIGDAINYRGIMPIFVSEGKYKEKLKTIERSNYLSFCYEALEQSTNDLVIFGSSLSNQDAHIVKAINHKRNRRDLAISIHIGEKSAQDLEKELKYFRNKFPRHKVTFYDSRTLFKF